MLEALVALLNQDIGFVTEEPTCSCRSSYPCNHKVIFTLWMTNIFEETVECQIWDSETIGQALDLHLKNYKRKVNV